MYYVLWMGDGINEQEVRWHGDDYKEALRQYDHWKADPWTEGGYLILATRNMGYHKPKGETVAA